MACTGILTLFYAGYLAKAFYTGEGDSEKMPSLFNSYQKS